MNNEINIKIPGQILDYVDTKEHLLDLFNYITNLQQENDNMEKIIKQNKYKKRILELEEGCSFLKQENERLKETLEEDDETLEKTFKLVAQLCLRIDKTINILNNIYMLENVTISNNAVEEIDMAINILQKGGDNDENI